MKLATLKQGGRDGTLVVVSRDLTRCRAVPAIARTLQAALDEIVAKLKARKIELESTAEPVSITSPAGKGTTIDGTSFLDHVHPVTSSGTTDPVKVTQ